MFLIVFVIINTFQTLLFLRDKDLLKARSRNYGGRVSYSTKPEKRERVRRTREAERLNRSGGAQMDEKSEYGMKEI